MKPHRLSWKVISSAWFVFTIMDAIGFAKFWTYYGIDNAATKNMGVLLAAQAGLWHFGLLRAVHSDGDE